MRKPVLFLALNIVTLLAVTRPSEALDLFGWQPFGGEKKTANAAPSTVEESAATATLKSAEELEAKGDLSAALKAYRGLVKASGFTSAAAKAQFKIGRILEQQGAADDAFKAYSTYTEKYPNGSEFDTVIQAQFGIAKVFLGGQKKKLLGVPVGTRYDRAQVMFGEIVKRAPFHKLAAMSQFNIGQALEKDAKPAEAIAAYQEVISRYPGDAVADDAHYQIGYVRLHETQEGSYDQADRVKARDSFEDFLNRYPASEKAAQARQNIQTLANVDVKGTADIARYYDKAKNYKAAAIYYSEVISLAHTGTEADYAKKRLGELKSLVGADALRSGPEKAESGAMALARRHALSKVDIASRPDFNGPPINYPFASLPGGAHPQMRTSPIGPVVEPALPTGDPLQNGALPPPLPAGDPLLAPLAPAPKSDAPAADDATVPTKPKAAKKK